MAAEEQTVLLDAQNPWPGLAPYDETSSEFFNGRDADAEELLRLVRLAPLTTLYSKSGLGKSSLLQAGLFPRLRHEHYLPVYVRLDCSAQMEGSPLEQVACRFITELTACQADFPERKTGEGLWQYLHRRDLEIWSPDNHLLTPVLVFDQFEEVFSRGGSNPETVRRLCHELADLIENRIPAEIASGQDGRQAAAQLDLLSQRYRIILSFREDFLPDLKNWERDVPSLLKNWWQLKPMSREQAIEAVAQAGAAVLAPSAAAAIVDFVGNLDEARNEGDNTIEPVLLSLCCYQLNLRRQQQRHPTALIDVELLRDVGQDILQDFYTDALARMPGPVAKFIETHLIVGDRYRASYPVQLAMEKGFINAAQLAELTGRHRLLRVDQQLGTARIELIHDRLVGVVRQARDRRLARLQARRAIRTAVIIALAAIALGGFFSIWQWQVAKVHERIASDKAKWAEILEQQANPNALSIAQSALADSKRGADNTTAVPNGMSSQPQGLIYIQIRNDGQSNRAEEIRAVLKKSGFVVPGIETLTTGPTTTEVRYFRKADEGQATRIADLLKDKKVPNVVTKYIGRFEGSNRIRPGQVEIWFAPNAFQ
ncbi:MAG TPA: hypothetical protein VLU73_12335 [Methylococcaceae bacterium]|jgi:hypothetical protein|nr:hypothetical protein [Methylococcaceae bacterium]